MRDVRLPEFPCVVGVEVRFRDLDAMGHVNNAVHYQLFDTAVNGWLIDTIGDVRALAALGVVAETSCRYLGELHFPEVVTVGLALERLGDRSVTYRLALFGERASAPVAYGRFVHVYVDRDDRRPVPVPDEVRAAVALLGRAPAQ